MLLSYLKYKKAPGDKVESIEVRDKNIYLTASVKMVMNMNIQ